MVLEMLEMNHAGEQEAALRVLKTVVPCTVRSKHKDKTPFRYCMQTFAGLYLKQKYSRHICLLVHFADFTLFLFVK